MTPQITALIENLAKTKIAQDPIAEPIIVQNRLLQDAFNEIADELAADIPLTGDPQFTPVTGTGWQVGNGITWQLLNGGATIQMTAVLNRLIGFTILPGVANGIVICTLPVQPAITQQLVTCVALASVTAGFSPEQQIEYGYLLLASTGTLTFFGHAPVSGFVNGTATIYVCSAFSLALPNPFLVDEFPDAWAPRELAEEVLDPADAALEADIEPAGVNPAPTFHRDAEENADGTHGQKDKANAFDWWRSARRLSHFLAKLYRFILDGRSRAATVRAANSAPTFAGVRRWRWQSSNVDGADRPGPSNGVQSVTQSPLRDV